MHNFTQTCQVVTAVIEQCMLQKGGGKLCMVSLYVELLTYIHCRVTKEEW